MTPFAIALLLVTITLGVVLPLAFRRSRVMRGLGILALLNLILLAWVTVLTSSRIAIEKNPATRSQGSDSPFIQGAIATRDAALQMSPEFWAAVVGLAVLAFVPLKPKS